MLLSVSICNRKLFDVQFSHLFEPVTISEAHRRTADILRSPNLHECLAGENLFYDDLSLILIYSVQ